MADAGRENDLQDLGSFDDESSVISVSATISYASLLDCQPGCQLAEGHEQYIVNRTNRRRNNGRPEDSRHSAAKSLPPPRT